MPDAVAHPDLTCWDLESLTADVVALAMKAGASDAESVAREGDEFSVNVRLGEVETLKESGSRALGLRVFLGKRSASTSTSDLTPDGVSRSSKRLKLLGPKQHGAPCGGLARGACRRRRFPLSSHRKSRGR